MQQVYFTVNGQEHNRHGQAALANLQGHGKAVQLGHVQIENRHLRPQFPDERECRFAIAAFGHHLEVRLFLDYLPQSFADDGVIIRDQNVNFAGH